MKTIADIFSYGEIVVIPIHRRHVGIGGVMEHDKQAVNKNKKAIKLVGVPYEEIDNLVATLLRFKEAKAKIEQEEKDAATNNKEDKIGLDLTMDDINSAWGNANFAISDRVRVLKHALLKCACGYRQGRTAENILMDLNLAKCCKNRPHIRLTERGRKNLYELFVEGDFT